MPGGRRPRLRAHLTDHIDGVGKAAERSNAAIWMGSAARSGDRCAGLPGWVVGEDVIVFKPCPREFREDVVGVARAREAGVTVAQVAADFRDR